MDRSADDEVVDSTHGPPSLLLCCPHLWREAQRQRVPEDALLAAARAMTPPLLTRAGACRHLRDDLKMVRCPYRADDVAAAVAYLRAGEGLDWVGLAACFTAGMSAAEARSALTDPRLQHVTPLLQALTDRPEHVRRGS